MEPNLAGTYENKKRERREQAKQCQPPTDETPSVGTSQKCVGVKKKTAFRRWQNGLGQSTAAATDRRDTSTGVRSRKKKCRGQRKNQKMPKQARARHSHQQTRHLHEGVVKHASQSEKQTIPRSGKASSVEQLPLSLSLWFRCPTFPSSRPLPLLSRLHGIDTYLHADLCIVVVFCFSCNTYHAIGASHTKMANDNLHPCHLHPHSTLPV